ncbi:MAG: hypothetical protein PF481_08770 [Bacteroidales bacterium]|jgi:nitrogen regulatory protein PII|nr:hypothetical protein [Bacteroidales bacterium]
MKAVMIFYNQSLTERVEYILEKLSIRGFSRWADVQGQGSKTGNPRMNTHTWPENNSSILTIVEDGKVEELLQKVKNIDSLNEEVGIRAFVWNIEQTV